MNESILSVLEHVRPSLPPGLIDEEGFQCLAGVAGRLPAELTTFWGFESRLGEARASADILFETRKQTRGQSLLAGQTPSSLDSLCNQSRVWRSLREFAGRWADPEHPFSTFIRNVWLEFDTAASFSNESGELVYRPCVFLGPDTKYYDSDQLPDHLVAALAVFGTEARSSRLLPSFMSSIPDGAALFQVGLMLSRVSSGLRVCVKGLSADTIFPWLDELEWSGDREALAELLKSITPLLRTMALNLNLTEGGPAEKIGLECYMDWLEGNSEQWQPLLDYIEERDLCLPLKREGLLKFPGKSPSFEVSFSPDSPIFFFGLSRLIHHIKLSFTEGRVAEAKAYLAVSRPGLYPDNSFSGERDAWLIE